DGIRDKLVTGVQTCALPIYRLNEQLLQILRVLYWRDASDLQQLLVETIVADMESDCGSVSDSEKPWALWREAFGGNSQRPEYSRSEERRVGKELRCGGGRLA